MKRGAAGAGVGATGEPAIAGVDPAARARAFAEPLLSGQRLDTGEDALGHADGVAALLASIGGAPSLCAAAYLVYAGDYLQRPEEVVKKAFGESYASLVTLTRKLVQIQRAAREAHQGHGAASGQGALQTERVRKMLLAFSRDLRVVLLRLASRLQTLRWFAAQKRACPQAIAQESLQVFGGSGYLRDYRWPTGWASGRSSGNWRTCRSASCSRPNTSAWRARWTRRAPSANAAWTPRASNWPSC